MLYFPHDSSALAPYPSRPLGLAYLESAAPFSFFPNETIFHFSAEPPVQSLLCSIRRRSRMVFARRSVLTVARACRRVREASWCSGRAAKRLACASRDRPFLARPSQGCEPSRPEVSLGSLLLTRPPRPNFFSGQTNPFFTSVQSHLCRANCVASA